MILKTSDKVDIAYDWYPAEKPAGYLVLVHMMPATKESWKDFALQMQKEGFSSIAIDLRGHGQSHSGPNGYEAFADEEHQQSIKDLEAAVEFLKKEGAIPGKITFVGASIGANLSLWYSADHPEISGAILLSAGESYRGIKAPESLAKLHSGQRVLMFSSEDDVRNSGNNASVSRRLIECVPIGVDKKLVVFQTGGHGTSLLAQAGSEISAFLKSR